MSPQTQHTRAARFPRQPGHVCKPGPGRLVSRRTPQPFYIPGQETCDVPMAKFAAQENLGMQEAESLFVLAYVPGYSPGKTESESGRS
jgi:hypothetical protein